MKASAARRSSPNGPASRRCSIAIESNGVKVVIVERADRLAARPDGL